MPLPFQVLSTQSPEIWLVVNSDKPTNICSSHKNRFAAETRAIVDTHHLVEGAIRATLDHARIHGWTQATIETLASHTDLAREAVDAWLRITADTEDSNA